MKYSNSLFTLMVLTSAIKVAAKSDDSKDHGTMYPTFYPTYVEEYHPKEDSRDKSGYHPDSKHEEKEEEIVVMTDSKDYGSKDKYPPSKTSYPTYYPTDMDGSWWGGAEYSTDMASKGGKGEGGSSKGSKGGSDGKSSKSYRRRILATERKTVGYSMPAEWYLGHFDSKDDAEWGYDDHHPQDTSYPTYYPTYNMNDSWSAGYSGKSGKDGKGGKGGKGGSGKSGKGSNRSLRH